MSNYVIYGLIAILALVLLVFFAVISQFIGLWIRAFFSNVRVSIFDLVGVQLRKIPPATIVNARIQATRAGLEISQSQMETHILAGGDLIRVIRSMIAADKANIDLPWDTSTAIDLAGRDVLVVEDLVDTGFTLSHVADCPYEDHSECARFRKSLQVATKVTTI